MPNSDTESAKPALIHRSYIFAFMLITSLFFMWAFANSLNDVLIKHFQKALDLTRGQSGFIPFCFYIGYFCMALPAGLIMKKYGYKNGVLIGLGLYAFGALMFYPAAEVLEYKLFLGALFIIGCGLTFLETAANPYITMMGDPATAAQRLNFAQSFNGLGVSIGVFLGGKYILSGIEYTPEELLEFTPQALEAFRSGEAQMVQTPYLILAAVVIALSILIYFARLPVIKEQSSEHAQPQNDVSLFKRKQLTSAVLAQFFYVGGQVCVWSFFINFATELLPSLGEKSAANYLSLSLLIFMSGRFLSTVIMTYIAARKLLVIYSAAAAGLCAVAIVSDGLVAVMALGAVSFFMSIMYPTIFALGVDGLAEKTKTGSSLLVMAIIGGAIFPLCMGYIADFTNAQIAVAVPLLCFVMVMRFALVYPKLRT